MPNPEGDAAFVALAEATLDDYLDSRPELATTLGDHRHDDRLDDLSPAGLDAQAAKLAQRRVELDAVDVSSLSAPNAVDAQILRNRLDLRLLELRDLREHEWNPLLANPGNAIYSLLSRDYAPVEDRLRALISRLEAVPERLALARGALGEMPRVHVETAITQFGGTIDLLGSELDAALEGAPALRGEVDAARPRALAALTEHRDWLRSRLEAAARDPRIGPDLYERKLTLTLDTGTRAADVRARAETDIERLHAEMAECAARLFGRDDVADALDRLAEDRPDNETIVPLCAASAVQAAGFVESNTLLTLPDAAVEVIVMPELKRGVAVAYCDSPGPLETAALPTFFAVSPTPEDWHADRVASFYREYNTHMVHNLTVHEAVPGHFVQIAHSNRHVGETRVRAAFRSGSFAEGWAVYAEALMAAHDYGGEAVRMQQLKMQLRCAINAVLDSTVHGDGVSEREAMRLMTERGFQEEGEAAGKWRRSLLTSAQLSTYYVGFGEVSAAVAALRSARPGATERAIHDEALSHGTPPPRHLPALLGL